MPTTPHRHNGIGGSDATRIMAGNWFALWEEKTERRAPEDLSEVLQVQIGITTEELNCRWFQRRTCIEVVRSGCANLIHPNHTFIRGNLDGWVPGGILECKHVSAFAKDKEIVSRYYPQVQHYLLLTDTPIAYLSVIFGNHRWEYFEVPENEEYQEELLKQETAFWQYVVTDTPPNNKNERRVEIALDDMREINMDGHNQWACYAHDWLLSKTAATKFSAATKGLKVLVESDVRLAFGHGVKVARSKNGALVVREMS